MNKSYIDIYCERTGPEFWSEPLNAVTNLAFIVAAWLVVRMLMRADAASRRDYAPWMFAGLIFVIGIGSGLFHTFATRWALLADIIPIAIFILLYTWYALRRFAAAPVSVCAAAVVAVLAVAQAVPPLTGLRGGAYVAALVALIAIGGYLKTRRDHSSQNPAAGNALLTAAVVFAVSLALRTADASVCGSFPVGTHFVWHLLNATVLFIVTRALVKFGAR
jgi:hypothetical protein